MKNKFLTKFLAIASCAALVCCGGGEAPPAREEAPSLLAVKGHVFPPRGLGSQSVARPDMKIAGAQAQLPLINYGGPIQTAPKVYVVYWGWTSDPAGVHPYLTRFLSSIGGSPWLGTLTQYGAGNQADMFSGEWSDPTPAPPTPSGQDVENEAAAALAHFGLVNAAAASANVQIVVATPTGHSVSGLGTSYCGYHDIVRAFPNATFTYVPYMPDAGRLCGAYSVNGSNGLLDGVSIVAGHELSETITNPLWVSSPAWLDATGAEVSDKCAWSNLANIATSLGTFAVQPLWSNAAGSCVLAGAAGAPPPLPSALMPSGVAGKPYSTSWAATDSRGNALAYALNGAPAGLGISSAGIVSWTAPVAGTYSFGINVTGQAGRVATGTETLVIARPPLPPVLKGADFSGLTGTPFSAAISGSDPNGGALTYVLAGGPGGLTIARDTGVLTWLTTTKGTYKFAVTARNSAGLSTTVNCTVTMKVPPSAPTLNVTTINGVLGKPLSYTVTASNPDGALPTFSLPSAPPGMTISTNGLLNWSTPTAGTSLIQVTATDPSGLASTAPFTVFIAQPPQLSGASLTGRAGVAFSSPLTAVDPNKGTLTYAILGGPGGLTVSTAGVLNWPVPVKGKYNFSVIVKSSAGASTSVPFTITIAS
jgi:serine protease